MTQISANAYAPGGLSLQQLHGGNRPAAAANGSRQTSDDEAPGPLAAAGQSDASAASHAAGDGQSVFRQMEDVTRVSLIRAQAASADVAAGQSRISRVAPELETDGGGQVSRAELVTSRLEAEGTSAGAGPEGHASAAGEAASSARSAPPPASGKSDREGAGEATDPVLTRTAADSQAQAETAVRFQRAAQTYGSAGVGAGSILGNEVRLVA